MRAAWAERACAAGLCVGAQVFLLGTGAAMPIALNSAWIASLAALPATAAVVALCRRAAGGVRPGKRRARMALLSLSLLGDALLAVSALVSLAGQSLSAQARVSWNTAVTLAAVVLCALSTGTGVTRLCYALRRALPALLLVLTAASMPLTAPVGLFPVLGAGAVPLGAAALYMLSAAAPAALLLLEPPALAQAGEEAQRCPAPGTGFFLGRTLSGALAGALLLLALCACNTYESIASLWGDRLRILSSGHPREGLPQTALTAVQLLCILLLGANALCAAEQALCCAFPRLGRFSLAPLALLLAAAVLSLVAFGFRMALYAAPGLLVLALPALFGRSEDTPP